MEERQILIPPSLVLLFSEALKHLTPIRTIILKSNTTVQHTISHQVPRMKAV